MPDHEILIRDVTTGDIASLAGLVTELGYSTTADDMAHRFTAISNDPAYKTFVADSAGELVGMVGVSRGYSYEQDGSYVRIVALVTKAAQRKKGIGKALMTAVEEWARAINATALLLNCGNRDERQAAHAFYQQIGFTAKSTGYVKRLGASNASISDR